MTTEHHVNPAVDDEDVTYCEVHPDRETALRCNRCGRLMCAECAVQTPVGYRCRQCVRQVEDTFFTGTNVDYLIVAGISAAGGALGLLLLAFIGFWILLAFFMAVIVGGALGQTILRLTGKRRSRYTAEVATGGAVGGALLLSVVLFGTLFPGIGGIIYIGVLGLTIYGRFKV